MLEVTQPSRPEFGLKSGGQQSCYIGPLLAGISLPDCEVRRLFFWLRWVSVGTLGISSLPFRLLAGKEP